MRVKRIVGGSKSVQLWAVLTVAAVGLTVILALLPEVGHDQMWHLMAAGRTIAGPMRGLDPYGKLYFESNPPLAIWFAALAVWLGRLMHLSVTAVFKGFVMTLGAMSGLVAARLLQSLRPRMTRAQGWFLIFAWVVVFGAVPARDFGQRDHLLVALALPYLAAAALWVAGRPLSLWARVAIAASGALGLAFKPHQALVAIAVEVLLLVLCRRVRIIEPLVFVAGALAYAGAVRWLAPTYLREIVPLLRDTYWAFGGLSFGNLLTQAIELILLLGGTLLLYFLRPAWRRSPLTLVLIIAGAAATCAYIMQGTGWYYQQLPGISFLSLALALELMDRVRVRTPGWAPAAACGLTVVALGLAAYFSDFQRTPQGWLQPQPIPDPAIFADLAPGTTVATLTTTVDDTVMPAARYHLVLALRYPHLWMLPAILRNQSGPTPRHVLSPQRTQELAALQRRFMVEDFVRSNPAVVLVNRCQDPQVFCQVLEDRHDDLLAFFLADPAFRTIWQRYRLIRSSGPYDEYVLTAR